ncbi:hypothetical protein HZU75_10880 [Chitinibacter fontanus]|uniref:Uncharacterized protein n=1 Tax=Chitinibacter fontanus TaxID=1737446 RepID=A0A7D5VAG1_9NEIS|nr:hypothetical protein [Chitinibacter fontanus]QLI81994.1 hypothetical protein HZU75_10880 [Chitinibacter fontanus]
MGQVAVDDNFNCGYCFEVIDFTAIAAYTLGGIRRSNLTAPENALVKRQI